MGASGGMTIGPASLDDLDAIEALEAAAFPGDRLSRRSLRALHPRAAPAVDRRPLRRPARRLRAAVGARGRPHRAASIRSPSTPPRAARRRPRAAAGLRALRARARARGAAARGALRQPGGDRALREDRLSPVRPLPRLLRGRRGGAALREAAGAASPTPQPSIERKSRATPASTPSAPGASATHGCAHVDARPA